MPIIMDVDKDKHRHDVDIATLSIPATAAATGFEFGDGTDFVIEAPIRVIDKLVECDGAQNLRTASCIEGVFDLTLATHLVPGITVREGEVSRTI